MPATSPEPAGKLWLGTVCGLISAVTYTAANIFLRAVADCDPIWVSAVKSWPTLLIMAPWVLAIGWNGGRIWPDRKTVGLLIFAGLLGQLGGNILFQWSLGIIGIALVVSLSLGTMILAGAILGRLFLAEAISPRTLLAIGILLAAIGSLSLGAGDASRSLTDLNITGETSLWRLTAGVIAAALCGVAYAVLGVVIRAVTGQVSVPMTLLIVAFVGAVSLGAFSFQRIGWSGMWQTRPEDLAMMLLAGICNAVAFFALSQALRTTPVVYVNSLNATQATLAAIAGVLLFGESLSWPLLFGVLLTIVGLVCMKPR